MDPQTHNELLSELRQLRDRVSEVEGYLEYQQQVSGWKSALGRIIHFFCLGVFLLQYFPWVLLLPMLARSTGFGVPPVLPDGRLNPQHAIAEMLFFVLGVGNAIALTLIIQIYVGDGSLRILSFAYVTFFLSVLMLNAANTKVRIDAGTDAVNAEDRFSGGMLRFFSVRVRAVTHSYQGAEMVLFLLVSACPTLVVVFCYEYFQTYQSSYTLDCTDTGSSDGFCNPTGSDVCCRAVRSSFEVTTFIAYLVGNVLGGYKFVQYSATLEVAYLTYQQSIQGGAAFTRDTKYNNLVEPAETGSGVAKGGRATDPSLQCDAELQDDAFAYHNLGSVEGGSTKEDGKEIG